MPVFTLHFERYEQHAALVEVHALDLADAIVKATQMSDIDAEWEPTANTEPRLYALSDGRPDKPLATVRLPDFSSAFSWMGVDLREQWGRASEDQPSAKELGHLAELLSRYFDSLAPDISDAGQADLDAERLRRDTRFGAEDCKSGI